MFVWGRRKGCGLAPAGQGVSGRIRTRPAVWWGKFLFWVGVGVGAGVRWGKSLLGEASGGVSTCWGIWLGWGVCLVG